MSENHKLSPLAYQEIDGSKYPSVVPPSQSPSEFTIRAIIVGIVIGIVFGAANAYLGLKVGQTVSASIPAAVISVAFFKFFFRKSGNTLLESNLVQTIGSAGESVAAGVIFTVPAFYMWGSDISVLDITIMSIVGGIMGVLFMIPMRKSLIVGEHGKLPYPEGTACAEVLVSGQGDASKAKPLFWGIGIGALFQALSHEKLFGLWNKEPVMDIPGYKGAQISAELSPELVGIGYIIGPKIACVIFGGAFLAWFVLLPLIVLIGDSCQIPIYPATMLIKDMTPSQIWSSYIKYIGAGGVAFAGIFSLLKTIPLMLSSFKASLQELRHTNLTEDKENTLRTDKDLSFKTILTFIAVLAVILTVYVKMAIFTDSIALSLLTGLLILIFSFFFVTVSARIVGTIGASACPLSGMVIATLLITCCIFLIAGLGNMPNAKMAILTIGVFVSLAASIADDTSQDLKTGFLVGSTPKYQQIGEIIGVITSGLVIGFVMLLMKDSICSGAFSAPQANLMKTVIEGVVDGNLPWTFVICGACVAMVIELLGVNSLSFAVGMYLPISVSAPMIVGAIIRWIIDSKKDNPKLDEKRESGILYSSGLIAGSALLGVVLMIFLGFSDNFSGLLTATNRSGIHIEAELSDVTINGQAFNDRYFKVTPLDIKDAEGNQYIVKAKYNGSEVKNTVTLNKLERAYLTVENGRLVSNSQPGSSGARALISFLILVASIFYFCLKVA